MCPSIWEPEGPRGDVRARQAETFELINEEIVARLARQTDAAKSIDTKRTRSRSRSVGAALLPVLTAAGLAGALVLGGADAWAGVRFTTAASAWRAGQRRIPSQTRDAPDSAHDRRSVRRPRGTSGMRTMRQGEARRQRIETAFTRRKHASRLRMGRRI